MTAAAIKRWTGWRACAAAKRIACLCFVCPLTKARRRQCGRVSTSLWNKMPNTSAIGMPTWQHRWTPSPSLWRYSAPGRIWIWFSERASSYWGGTFIGEPAVITWAGCLPPWFPPCCACPSTTRSAAPKSSASAPALPLLPRSHFGRAGCSTWNFWPATSAVRLRATGGRADLRISSRHLGGCRRFQSQTTGLLGCTARRHAHLLEISAHALTAGVS